MRDFIARLCCFLAATTLAILPCLSAPPHLGVVARKNAGGGPIGTDWTADSTLKGLYYFESGAFDQDSSGNGNHLDDAASSPSPSANAVDFIQGTQSATFTTAGTDTGLGLSMAAATDFPADGAGDGEVTIAGWINADSFETRYLASWEIGYHRLTMDSSGQLSGKFWGSGSTDVGPTPTPITTGEWWFVGISYSDAGNTLSIYKRKLGDTSSEWTSVASTIGTLTSRASNKFMLGVQTDGGTFGFDGEMDAWAVFNGKALSKAELDGIFDYGFDGNGW